jgi:hypothetical protein
MTIHENVNSVSRFTARLKNRLSRKNKIDDDEKPNIITAPCDDIVPVPTLLLAYSSICDPGIIGL